MTVKETHAFLAALCAATGTLRLIASTTLQMSSRATRTTFQIMLALALITLARTPAMADADAADKKESSSSASDDIWKREKLTGDWDGLRKSSGRRRREILSE